MDKENTVPECCLCNNNNICPSDVLSTGTSTDTGTNKDSSLQDAFSKFRDRKIKQLQLQKASRKACVNRTPEEKDVLRQKFVEQLKKYIDVPYAERYKAPDDPVAPLYLDCCALVRKENETLPMGKD